MHSYKYKHAWYWFINCDTGSDVNINVDFATKWFDDGSCIININYVNNEMS